MKFFLQFWMTAALTTFAAATSSLSLSATSSAAFVYHNKGRKKWIEHYQYQNQCQHHQQGSRRLTTSLHVTNDRFDMEELMQRIREENNPFLKLFGGGVVKDGPKSPPEDVHIILFKPYTDEQGVHTIEFPQGSGNNFILAFESKLECDKFAATLKAQQFFDPTPQLVPFDDLEAFCETLGVFVQLIPAGMDLLPPSQNVKSFGHNPSLKEQKSRLDYIFEMDDAELEETGLQVVDVGPGSWE